jgi:acyl-CoA synthetase (NDP forming)/GNAT superfamily N-acetyltransferase
MAESTVVLGNGDTAVIRPLTPDDSEALAEFHRRQSRDSIYRRFFSPKPELTQQDLDHFTDVDMVDRVALAVESHGQLVAWASYEKWPGRSEAEVAFMVDDGHQGQGIATLLLEHLATIAASHGIDHFTAEVLADNRPMLAVFAKAGWPLERRFDSGVVDLDWELASTDEFLDSVERREQRADSRAIARLLLPRAIAVIGASDRPGSVGEALWRHVRASVQVPVFAVNPARAMLGDQPCHRSVVDLPDEVSLAIVAVPAHALESTIDQCIAKRMRGAVIVTSVEGAGIDIARLVDRARRNGLRLIGPASMGIASPRPETLLQASLVDVALPPGHIAVSMQSGSLGGSLLRQAADLELGLSWFISLGDKADISGNDLIQFWLDDQNTRVVAMYTESFGNPGKFVRIARRASTTMPIVAVRTGSAARDAGGDALYQQAGVIEVPTVTDLLDTARVFASQPLLRGPRVAVLSNARSPGILARAALATAGLEAVDPRLRLDWRSAPEMFARAITDALADDDVDGVLVIHAPAVASAIDSVGGDIDRAALGCEKPVVAVLLGQRDGPVISGSAVPAFAFPEQAAAVLGRAFAYTRWLDSEAATEPEPAEFVDPDPAGHIIDEILADGRDTADLDETRRLLGAYGIEFANAVAATPDTAARAAELIGFPVAVKSARRRAGRSVRAGVALDVTSSDEVAKVAVAMHESLGADADLLVVQAMTSPGLDVRIRCTHDDRLGVVVSVGLGGAQADLIADRTHRLAPLSSGMAASMLRETRVGDALGDYGIDAGTLVNVIVRAAQLAADHHRIVDLDLNPVLAFDGGTVVTDAVIRLVDSPESTVPLRQLN